ncbi:hypothetical protein MM239_17780 [Belliella sp. DSM 111904]|uniref:HPt domain-containing protein n=1 Tax=Belliella filtrata TaxID=2923435 RepID=A0ABS9V4A5_9BACT|nr:hypothetical protein [Belliella filtrata]MCH7411252.1 hypothetical protein [Belliella filtrata]
MNNNNPINLSRVDEMAEGDVEFKRELLSALHTSLLELRDKYLEGSEKEDNEAIQQIRHKVKPTLAMFEMQKLERIVLQGKVVIEENGFKGEFLSHLESFLDAWQDAYDYLKAES